MMAVLAARAIDQKAKRFAPAPAPEPSEPKEILTSFRHRTNRNVAGVVARGYYRHTATKLRVYNEEGQLLGAADLRPGDHVQAAARKLLKEKCGGTGFNLSSCGQKGEGLAVYRRRKNLASRSDQTTDLADCQSVTNLNYFDCGRATGRGRPVTCRAAFVFAQAVRFRRLHQPRRPPLARIRPGSPAPATGPGTDVGPIWSVKLSSAALPHVQT